MLDKERPSRILYPVSDISPLLSVIGQTREANFRRALRETQTPYHINTQTPKSFLPLLLEEFEVAFD